MIDGVVKSLGGLDAQVSLEVFLSKPFWFDETEKSKDRDYSVPFPRVAEIKALLWKTNADASQTYLKVDQLVQFLSIASANKKAKDFDQFLFAEVKTLQQ